MFNYQLLKQLRKDLRLSQQEMANRLNMEQSTYNRYETNKAQPGFSLLEKLKSEFGAEPADFFKPYKEAKTKEMLTTELENAKPDKPGEISKEHIKTLIKNHEEVLAFLKNTLKSM